MASPAFDLRTRDVVTESNQAFACLTEWKKLIEDTGKGGMVITRDGEHVKVTVSKSGQKEEIDIKISHLQVHHTFKRLVDDLEYWPEVPYPDVGLYYEAEVLERKADFRPFEVLHINVSLRCENQNPRDKDAWDKEFSFSGPKIPSAKDFA